VCSTAPARAASDWWCDGGTVYLDDTSLYSACHAHYEARVVHVVVLQLTTSRSPKCDMIQASILCCKPKTHTGSMLCRYKMIARFITGCSYNHLP
jgi:hypothetical protein